MRTYVRNCVHHVRNKRKMYVLGGCVLTQVLDRYVLMMIEQKTILKESLPNGAIIVDVTLMGLNSL